MDLNYIIFNNGLLNYNLIDDTVIQKIVESETNNNYGFNFLFRMAPIDKDVDFNKKYEFGYDTLTKINSFLEEPYTDTDIKIIATYFTFRTIEWDTRNNIEGILDFCNEALKLVPVSDIAQWVYEELQFIAIQLYSQNVENYKNGTIGKLIDLLQPKMDNHTKNLILDQ